MIYSPNAIDHSAGFDIYDPIENKIYTEEEARKQPKEIISRLILKPRKIGCYVKTLEEL